MLEEINQVAKVNLEALNVSYSDLIFVFVSIIKPSPQPLRGTCRASDFHGFSGLETFRSSRVRQATLAA